MDANVVDGPFAFIDGKIRSGQKAGARAELQALLRSFCLVRILSFPPRVSPSRPKHWPVRQWRTFFN